MSSFSVIIPTYNRKPLVIRALISVFNQTLLPDEVIVVDDGSTDGTQQEVSRHFPQVIYLYQTNKGVSAARNRGIVAARGEWIAFLDSDDEWLPQKLEKQMAALHQKPEFRICHTEEIWIRRGKRVNPRKKHRKYGGYIFPHCLPLCIISPSSVIIHRSIFETYGLFDETLPAVEDYDLWLRICAQEPVLFLDEPLIVKYGGHADQLSQKHWGMDRFRIYAMEKLLHSGILTPEQQRQTIEELLRKLAIFIQGAQKRGKVETVTRYQEKQRYYSAILSRLQTSQSAG